MALRHSHKRLREHDNVKIAVFLNIGFTIIEFIGGALTNSLAILADALHDLGDSMVLLSTWKIEGAARRKPDWKRTFGYWRLSLLAAFLNAVVLLGGSIIIVFQVIGRLIKPQPVSAEGMVGLAVIGITVNTIASIRLKKSGNINERILSWHLLEDVLGWVGILIAGTVIYFTKFYRLDPLITICFTLFVLWGVWRNSRELFNLFTEGVPAGSLLAPVVEKLQRIKGVVRIYDIHMWSLDGSHNFCSLKATVEDGEMKNYHELRGAIERILAQQDISHSTVELKEERFYARREQEQEFLEKNANTA